MKGRGGRGGVGERHAPAMSLEKDAGGICGRTNLMSPFPRFTLLVSVMVSGKLIASGWAARYLHSMLQ